MGLLLRIDSDRRVHARWPRPGVEYGHRLCRAFETYRTLFEQPLLSFEWAWNLMNNIAYNDELFVSGCRLCDAPYVQDAFAIDPRLCPACALGRETHHGKPS